MATGGLVSLTPSLYHMLIQLSMTVVMKGYDVILIGKFREYPTTEKKYRRFVGVNDKKRSGYQLTPACQARLGKRH